LGLKVWVVEEGYYSDRGIGAIFSTREKAEKYIDVMKKYSYNYSDIHDKPEEYDLDPQYAYPQQYFEFNHFYWVSVDKDGYINGTPVRSGIDLMNPENTKQHFYFKKDFNENDITLEGFVNANDEKHAYQILNKKRKEIIDQWPKPEDFDVWNSHINVY
jgi:hypothetical protein